MDEEIQLYLDEAQELMDKAIEHVNHEFSRIRAGKATPNMLDGVMVEYYGSPTPINQVATINTPDARSIVIRPWEKGTLANIERAIVNSDLGLNPQNDGEIVRLNIPPLTEDRRKDLVKQAKHEAEQGKVSLRNVRKDANDSIRKLSEQSVSEDAIKRGEDKVQAMTDTHVAEIDKLFEKKEKDIMTV